MARHKRICHKDDVNTGDRFTTMAIKLNIDDTGTELPAMRFYSDRFAAGVGDTYSLEIWQEASDYFLLNIVGFSWHPSENGARDEIIDTDETIGTYSTLLEALAAVQAYAHEQEL